MMSNKGDYDIQYQSTLSHYHATSYKKKDKINRFGWQELSQSFLPQWMKNYDFIAATFCKLQGAHKMYLMVWIWLVWLYYLDV